MILTYWYGDSRFIFDCRRFYPPHRWVGLLTMIYDQMPAFHTPSSAYLDVIPRAFSSILALTTSASPPHSIFPRPSAYIALGCFSDLTNTFTSCILFSSLPPSLPTAREALDVSFQLSLVMLLLCLFVHVPCTT